MVTITGASPYTRQDMHTPGDSIPFALSVADERVYEPRAVPLGKNCGCVCPGCKQPVYAKHCLSGKRAPHFAHAPGSDCATGFETALHLAAKQLIEARAVLAFPELVASLNITDDMGKVHKPERQLVAAGRRPLKSVVLEEKLGQIRPDIRVDAEGVGIVLVEVAVTHFVDEHKLQQIAQERIPAIEIDLSKFRDATFAALERALFHDPHCTKWLYHPGVAKAKRDLRESIQWLLDAATRNAELIARARAETDKQKRAEHDAQMLAEAARRKDEAEKAAERARAAEEAKRLQRNDALRKAAAFKSRPEELKRQILLRRLGLDQLPAIIAADVRGAASFGVEDPVLWQATLFGGLVHKQPAQGNRWVTRNYARAWMRHRFTIRPSDAQYADLAIDDYLARLSDRGALYPRENDSYAIAIADLASFQTLNDILSDRNFDPTRLIWTPQGDWPGGLQVRILTEVMVRGQHAVTSWVALAKSMRKYTNSPPIKVCERVSKIGLPKEVVARYLVRTGFLRVAAKVTT